MCKPARLAAAVAALVLAGAMGLVLAQPKEAAPEVSPKRSHVPEDRALLSKLRVDEARTHKNMVVFPIRWAGIFRALGEIGYTGFAALESFVDCTDNMNTWVWRQLATDGDTLVREGLAFIRRMQKKHGLT